MWVIDIRTYAVMPLNEECGLLEWVVNTHALKNILDKGYQRQGKRIWVRSHQSLQHSSSRRTLGISELIRYAQPHDLPRQLDTARKVGPTEQTRFFKDVVLPQ